MWYWVAIVCGLIKEHAKVHEPSPLVSASVVDSSIRKYMCVYVCFLDNHLWVGTYAPAAK